MGVYYITLSDCVAVVVAENKSKATDILNDKLYIYANPRKIKKLEGDCAIFSVHSKVMLEE